MTRRSQVRDAFLSTASKLGWETTTRGWPDYFCFRLGRKNRTEVSAVVLNTTSTRRLRKDQRDVVFVLQACGIPCYQFSLDKGMIRISPHPEKE